MCSVQAGWSGSQSRGPRAGLPSEGRKQAQGWACRNTESSVRAKCKALHPGRKMPWPRYRLETCQVENSSVGKDLGVLVKDRAKLFTAVCGGEDER